MARASGDGSSLSLAAAFATTPSSSRRRTRDRHTHGHRLPLGPGPSRADVGPERDAAIGEPGLGRRGSLLRALGISDHWNSDGCARFATFAAQLLHATRAAHRAGVRCLSAFQHVGGPARGIFERGGSRTAARNADMVLDLLAEHSDRASELERQCVSHTTSVVAGRRRAVLSALALRGSAHVARQSPTYSGRVHRRRRSVPNRVPSARELWASQLRAASNANGYARRRGVPRVHSIATLRRGSACFARGEH